MSAIAPEKGIITPALFSSAVTSPRKSASGESLFDEELMRLYDPPKSGEPYENDRLWFDTKRADDILLEMLFWFNRGLGHYQHNNVANAPQNVLMPSVFHGKVPTQINLDGTSEEEKAIEPMKIGSRDHLQWLFPTVGSDRRQESTNVYRNHSLLYHEKPGLYRGEAQHLEPRELEKILREFKFGIPEDTSRYWPHQARTLFKCFAGDPIKLLEYCGGTVAGVLAFKKNWRKEVGSLSLPGFGPKITSLLFLFYEELGKFPMPDDAFAVDVHVQRFFLQTKTVLLKERVIASMLERVLRPYLCGFCARFSKSKVDLAHALWQNGAKMCDVCTRQKGADVLCPIEKCCTGPVSTKTYTQKSTWEHPLVFQPKYKDRSFSVSETGTLFSDTA
ncbi:MAG: hypothetical protein QG653_246 [Patescibacteria group bacterium]|nr:hypothetical protein [Patescibacteria group bacterium]